MMPNGEEWSRPIGGFAASVAFAGLGAAILWATAPNRLSVTTDIVGYVIFSGFDIYRYIYGFYVVALLFPFLAIVFYQLIAWRRPLQYQGGTRSPLLPLTTVPEAGGEELVSGPAETLDREPPPPLGQATTSELSDPRLVGTVPRTSVIDGLWMGARIALPAAAIIIELSVIQVLNHRTGTSIGYLGGCLYVVAVILMAIAFRRSSSQGAHSSPSVGATTWRPCLARANSLLAVAVVPLIYFVSRSTTVAIGSEHHLVRYPWFPWWLAVVVTLACLVLWLRCAHHAAKPDDLLELEAGILTWLVGPVLLFLVLALLPGALGSFQAFDDAQYLAAPQLIFQHGLFPWRDIYVLHGLLEDVFDGKIGMILFGNTRWGATAGISLIVDPLNMTFGAVLAIVAGTTTQTRVSTVLAQVPSDFHPVIQTNALSALPHLGYTLPGAVDTKQIRALGSILDRYAGPTAPVFDYSNEPGILYYLLNRVPGSRFYYSAVVQTPLAQQEDL